MTGSERINYLKMSGHASHSQFVGLCLLSLYFLCFSYQLNYIILVYKMQYWLDIYLDNILWQFFCSKSGNCCQNELTFLKLKIK